MTNKSKFYFYIIAVLILAFSIVLGILLNDKYPIDIENGKVLYLIVKIVVSFTLVLGIFYCMSKNKDIANIVIQIGVTVILQFLPLLVRILVAGDEPRFILAVILSFIFYIVYLGVFLGLDILNDKVMKAKPELEGKRRTVVDDDAYNDENGKFVGANKK